jgi:hypothetical protein
MGHGTCNKAINQCDCEQGWKGNGCHIPDCDCNGVNAKCEQREGDEKPRCYDCAPPYIGDKCQYRYVHVYMKIAFNCLVVAFNTKRFRSLNILCIFQFVRCAMFLIFWGIFNWYHCIFPLRWTDTVLYVYLNSGKQIFTERSILGVYTTIRAILNLRRWLPKIINSRRPLRLKNKGKDCYHRVSSQLFSIPVPHNTLLYITKTLCSGQIMAKKKNAR